MKDPERHLLFSITAADFVWECSRGTGNGGQKRNKTSSKVRCFHPPSGAEGVDDATRSQHLNRRAAWLKCINHPKFQAWHRVEVAKRTGALASTEDAVARSLADPAAVRIEVHDEDGRWVVVEKADLDSEE
jgi:protein subunit release factor A